MGRVRSSFSRAGMELSQCIGYGAVSGADTELSQWVGYGAKSAGKVRSSVSGEGIELSLREGHEAQSWGGYRAHSEQGQMWTHCRRRRVNT